MRAYADRTIRQRIRRYVRSTWEAWVMALILSSVMWVESLAEWLLK